jgi:hypothetical protein
MFPRRHAYLVQDSVNKRGTSFELYNEHSIDYSTPQTMKSKKVMAVETSLFQAVF